MALRIRSTRGTDGQVKSLSTVRRLLICKKYHEKNRRLFDIQSFLESFGNISSESNWSQMSQVARALKKFVKSKGEFTVPKACALQ